MEITMQVCYNGSCIEYMKPTKSFAGSRGLFYLIDK